MNIITHTIIFSKGFHKFLIISVFLHIFFISLQHFLHIFSGIGRRMLCYLLRRTACHNCSATVTTIRSHVNNIVCCLNDIQVMLNYNNGISVIGQTLQDFYQLVYICKMKSGCRLIQNIMVFPVLLRLNSVASLILCASPPDNVVEGCPSLI